MWGVGVADKRDATNPSNHDPQNGIDLPTGATRSIDQTPCMLFLPQSPPLKKEKLLSFGPRHRRRRGLTSLPGLSLRGGQACVVASAAGGDASRSRRMLLLLPAVAFRLSIIDRRNRPLHSLRTTHSRRRGGLAGAAGGGWWRGGLRSRPSAVMCAPEQQPPPPSYRCSFGLPPGGADFGFTGAAAAQWEELALGHWLGVEGESLAARDFG